MAQGQEWAWSGLGERVRVGVRVWEVLHVIRSVALSSSLLLVLVRVLGSLS